MASRLGARRVMTGVMLRSALKDKEGLRNLWRIPAWALLWPVVCFVLASLLDRYGFRGGSKVAGSLFLALFLLANPVVGLAVLVSVLVRWRSGTGQLAEQHLGRVVGLACLNIVEPVLLVGLYVFCCFTR